MMANDLLVKTLLKIPENKYYDLSSYNTKDRDIGKKWVKIAKFSLEIKENPELYLVIGFIKGKLNIGDSEDCFKKAIEMSENKKPEFYVRIGDFYGDELKDYRKGIYYYTKVIKFPNMRNYENYAGLGALYGLKGDHENAVYYFDKAIECPDIHFNVYGLKAQSLMQLEEYDEADICFEEYLRRIDLEIESNPRDIDLLRAKAVTLASMGKKREALDVFLKIEEINPNADFLKDDLRRFRL